VRLWSLHPKYLDSQGLVGLWRESLLAKAVLEGRTQGYKHHPQLNRFKFHATPVLAVNVYLLGIQREAETRGYAFDAGKIGPVDNALAQMPVSTGQMEYEWGHLLAKLALRSPAVYEKMHPIPIPECHPMFRIRRGEIEGWERPVNR